MIQSGALSDQTFNDMLLPTVTEMREIVKVFFA